MPLGHELAAPLRDNELAAAQDAIARHEVERIVTLGGECSVSVAPFAAMAVSTLLGLGRVPGGLTRSEVRRIVADLNATADVVGPTIAEFIPRDVLARRRSGTRVGQVRGGLRLEPLLLSYAQ